jgi:tetratricopeptide (TPR) repeat protein
LIDDTDNKKALVQLTDFFSDIEKTAAENQSIGTVLMRCGHFKEGVERHNLFKAAIEYGLKSLEQDENTTVSSFHANWLVADVKTELGIDLKSRATTELQQDSGNEQQEKARDEALKDFDSQHEDKVHEKEQQTSGPENSQKALGNHNGRDTEQRDENLQHENEAPESWRLEFEEAVQHLEEALKVVPAGWRDNPSLEECVEIVLINRALCERMLGRPADALNTYNKARAVRPQVTMDGFTLDDITRVRNWEDNPKAYVELLQSWKPEERISWFSYLFEVNDQDSVEYLNRFIKLAGPDYFDFLIRCYDDYIKMLPRSSAGLVGPRTALADVHRLVLNENKKALDIYSEILDTEFKDDEAENLDWRLLMVRLKLTDVIFSEFRASTVPSEKIELLNKMKELHTFRVEKEIADAMAESQSTVMLAIMTRTIGSAVEFQDIMEKAFKSCLDGLSDSVGWNDTDSFRMLTKVLACMPGLERDAQIALSCQFYITDPAVDHSFGGSGTAKADNDEDEDAENKNERSGPDNAAEPSKEEVNTTALTNGECENARETEICGIKTNGHVDETVIAETIISVKPEITSENPAEKQNEAAATTTTTTTTVEVKIDVEVEKGDDKNDNDEEGDLAPDAIICCDGPDCTTTVNRWSQPFYFCIHCANCDLCSRCHEKRVAMNNNAGGAAGGESESQNDAAGEAFKQEEEKDEVKEGNKQTTDIFWRSWCGPNHRYVKAPIPGWRGVKGGVIRVLGEPDLTFRDWLDGLRGRWVEAWGRFWKGEGFLRDVGV